MTSVVFYRKYRPQMLKEIVGQAHVVTILERALAQHRIAHAYLFSGPRGTGKTTIARIIARELECMPEDIIEIDAASSRGIDEARALRDAVRFLPLRSPKKVYIIDEVHMLTKEAFNALLKTIEEPPEHVVFILATTELEKVPDTIVSRTQHFSFHKIAIPDIARELARIARLEKLSIEEDALKLIAFFADGALRDAENLLFQMQGLGEKTTTERDVRILLGAPEEENVNNIIEHALMSEAHEMFKVFNKVLHEGADPKMLARLLLRNARALYLLSADQATKSILQEEFTKEEIERFFAILQKVQKRSDARSVLARTEYTVSLLLEAARQPADDFLAHIPLELALLKIATRQ